MTLTADQLLLAQEVRHFADREIAPHALDWDRRGHFPVEVLARAGDMGMGGIVVPEEWGGSGLGRLDAALIIEALATACPTIASYVSIHNMTAGMISAYGTDAQRERYLPGMCAMTALGSYCLTEPGAGSDAAALATRAVRDGGDFVITGVKQFISGAGSSAVYVVMARTADAGSRGITAFLVDADTPGLSFGPDEVKMGWHAQPTRAVMLDEVRVPETAVLGEVDQGFRIAMSGLNGGRINIAASSLGGAASALEKARRYLGERTAFGQRLQDFQALTFQLADMATDLHAARLLVHDAARALDSGAADAVTRCAMAKAFATEKCFAIADAALQLHGGYGYLAEYGVEKIVRDLRVHRILEGTNEIMRVIIGRDLVGR